MYAVILEYMNAKLQNKLLCNDTECLVNFIQASDKAFS
jgi:hypothetical protein